MTKRIIESPIVPIATSVSYDGKHRLEFKESSHRYKLNGEHCVGVTTFIHDGYPTSRNLISWMIGQGAEHVLDKVIGADPFIIEENQDQLIKEAKTAYQKKSKDAADIGSYIHEIAYLTELGKTDEARTKILEAVNRPDGAKIISAVEKFQDWKKDNTDEIVKSEELVASISHNYCGKFDRLVKRNGVLILSDFKTSGGIYPEMFIQLGAYALAIEEWLGYYNIEGLEVLRFGKENGEFQTLLIDKPEEIQMFKEQAIRCRETFQFRKIESDPRFEYGGKSVSKGAKTTAKLGLPQE